jgi:hypothetical protein
VHAVRAHEQIEALAIPVGELDSDLPRYLLREALKGPSAMWARTANRLQEHAVQVSAVEGGACVLPVRAIDGADLTHEPAGRPVEDRRGVHRGTAFRRDQWLQQAELLKRVDAVRLDVELVARRAWLVGLLEEFYLEPDTAQGVRHRKARDACADDRRSWCGHQHSPVQITRCSAGH